MIFSYFTTAYQELILFAFLCVLPLAANSSTGVETAGKRIEVAMRMIGHEVLIGLSDCESRILPIEKIDGHYKISFESEFGFDPADMVSIIDRVMAENSIATNYIVEVEQCETGEVVHSFAVGYFANPSMIPCLGRVLPEDCYSLLITILDGNPAFANLQAATSDGSSLTAAGTKKSNLSRTVFIVILSVSLVGFIAYIRKNKKPADVNPHLITIGAYQFDKRNFELSHQNKKVELSSKEAELLSLLHNSANAPLKRDVILQRVWGDDGDYVGRTLDVFISKLRKKLEADANVKIVNIRGVGYKLIMNV